MTIEAIAPSTFELYVVVWQHNGRGRVLEFDDCKTALACAMQLEEQGKAEIMVSGPTIPDVKPEWIDAARERVWAAILSKLREENARLRMANQNRDLFDRLKAQHEGYAS